MFSSCISNCSLRFEKEVIPRKKSSKDCSRIGCEIRITFCNDDETYGCDATNAFDRMTNLSCCNEYGYRMQYHNINCGLHLQHLPDIVALTDKSSSRLRVSRSNWNPHFIADIKCDSAENFISCFIRFKVSYQTFHAMMQLNFCFHYIIRKKKV